MGAIADLWKSERGLLTAIILIAASVLAGLAILTAEQWLDLTKFIFITYVSGKTVTGAVSIWKGTPDPVPTPSSAPTPVTPAETSDVEVKL